MRTIEISKDGKEWLVVEFPVEVREAMMIHRGTRLYFLLSAGLVHRRTGSYNYPELPKGPWRIVDTMQNRDIAPILQSHDVDIDNAVVLEKVGV